MIRILRFIRLALRSPGAVKQTEGGGDRISRNIVKRFSHGNIRLQRGEYVTKKQIKERYERIKSFDFDQ